MRSGYYWAKRARAKFRLLWLLICAPRYFDGTMSGDGNGLRLFEMQAPRWWQFWRFLYVLAHDHVIELTVERNRSKFVLPAVAVCEVPGARHKRRRP